MKKVSETVDSIYVKLKDLEHVLVPSDDRSNSLGLFSLLDLSIDDAVQILQNLRKFFSFCSRKDQEKLMTMFPSAWGRDRIARWFSGSEHQARCSLNVKTISGMFSSTVDHRGNKVLDDEIGDLVQEFYLSDENSRESSNKKEVISLPSSKTPVALRFLHLTVGETYEKFKQKYADIKISRSKFCALRPINVREKSTHINCLCLQHANIHLLIEVSCKSFLNTYLLSLLIS